MENMLLKLLESGLLVAALTVAVIYFARREKERDKYQNDQQASTTARLNSLEEWIRTELKDLTERHMEVIEKNTKALQAQADASHECASANRHMLALLNQRHQPMSNIPMHELRPTAAEAGGS